MQWKQKTLQTKLDCENRKAKYVQLDNAVKPI